MIFGHTFVRNDLYTFLYGDLFYWIEFFGNSTFRKIWTKNRIALDGKALFSLRSDHNDSIAPARIYDRRNGLVDLYLLFVLARFKNLLYFQEMDRAFVIFDSLSGISTKLAFFCERSFAIWSSLIRNASF